MRPTTRNLIPNSCSLKAEEYKLYDGKNQKEMTYEDLIQISAETIISCRSRFIDKIPNHGDKSHAKITFYVNNIYLTIPSNNYLLRPETRERISDIRVDFWIKKNVESYPLTSLYRYQRNQVDTCDNLLNEFYEYKGTQDNILEVIIDKGNNAVLYIDLNQLADRETFFDSVTIKCRRTVKINKIKFTQISSSKLGPWINLEEVYKDNSQDDNILRD